MFKFIPKQKPVTHYHVQLSFPCRETRLTAHTLCMMVYDSRSDRNGNIKTETVSAGQIYRSQFCYILSTGVIFTVIAGMILFIYIWVMECYTVTNDSSLLKDYGPT
jgi:hypothetical protein